LEDFSGTRIMQKRKQIDASKGFIRF